MKKIAIKYVYLLPVVMLLATAYTCFIDVIKNEYDYVVVGNIFGYSIITNILAFVFFNYYGKFCWYSKKIPFFLLIINFTDIIAWMFLDDSTYLKMFQLFLCILIIISVIYMDIKLKVKNKYIKIISYMLLTYAIFTLLLTLLK